MKVKTVEFAVTRNNGSITNIGRSVMCQPKTSFTGGTVKWHEDKPKRKGN